MRSIECLVCANSGAELGGPHEQCVLGRERDVREDILQIFSENQGVVLRREKTKYYIKCFLCCHRDSIGAG